MPRGRHRRIRTIAVAAGAWYMNDCYRAAPETHAAPENGTEIEIRKPPGDDAIAFVPAKPQTGLVFCPGGKVEPEACAPLMRELAERGFLPVLLSPPLSLAILDQEQADAIPARFPDIDTWILAGHSRGGVGAATCAAEPFLGL